jgi:hypothetical protein
LSIEASSQSVSAAAVAERLSLSISASSPKMVPGACLLEHAALLLGQGDAAALHHVHPVGAIALGEDRLARLEGLGISGPLQQSDESLLRGLRVGHGPAA